MRNLNKLKGAPAEFRNVSIAKPKNQIMYSIMMIQVLYGDMTNVRQKKNKSEKSTKGKIIQVVAKNN